MNDVYLNLAIKRQAILERLKSNEVRNFAREIKKVETLIRRAILGLDEEFSELSRTKLNNLIALLRRDQAKIYNGATAAFLKDSARIAAVYMHQELLDLNNTIDLRGTKLNAFTNKEVFSKVIKRPLSTDGELLEPWLKDFTNRETRRMSNIIRAGHSHGLTNQEMVQQITGTKPQGFKNGLFQKVRRNASTVVRTSVQHVASAARHEIWEANRDVIQRYEFIATLDRITSNVCRTLDGQEFDFGKGPIPPVHPNCRSTTIPVLDPKFQFLSKGRTRSAEFGPVSKETSYYDWLKRQNKADQVAVLGPTRATLFRDGGLTPKQFSDLQFDKTFTPLTLDGMRTIEPAAFEMAGL